MLQEFFFEFFRSVRTHSVSIFVTLIVAVTALMLLANSKDVISIALIARLPLLVMSTSGTFILIHMLFRVLYLLPEMVTKIRPKSPIRYLVNLFLDSMRDFRFLANFLIVALIFSIFSTAFSINKALIGVEIGFNWDTFLSRIDRLILLGSYPHEFFLWVPKNKFIFLAYEVTYLLWFYVYYFSISAVAARLIPDNLGQRFLLSSVICWFCGGNVIAAIFNSSGPIFFELHGIYSYLPYITSMQDGAISTGSFALTIKDRLLESFTSFNFSSISAFPSMHVASTLLLCFFSKEVSRLTFGLSIVFFILIFTGSFILLWHYLVDAIAGSIIAVVSWLVAGKIIRLQGRCSV